MSNAKHLRGSAWLNFNRVLCERWSTSNVVLLGDAAATAHFSVGSGTKLAHGKRHRARRRHLRAKPTCRAAFAPLRGRAPRSKCCACRTRRATRPNGSRTSSAISHLDPVQFNYSLLTRSQRISHENLRAARSGMAGGAEKWFERRRPGARPNAARAADVRAVPAARARACEPRRASRRWRSTRRVDGCPNDWHFAHYAERAKGGAGLVFTEMTCVSPEGRISPGCTGLYSARARARLEAARRFRARRDRGQDRASSSAIPARRARPSSAGRRSDAPLPDGQLAGDRPPRPCRGRRHNQMPQRDDRADMDRVRDEFVASAEMAARVRLRHGSSCTARTAICCRPSSRRSPTGARDEYGGTLENRMRFPLEVFRAVRAAWPDEKPISVRISAHDWVGADGITPAGRGRDRAPARRRPAST